MLDVARPSRSREPVRHRPRRPCGCMCGPTARQTRVCRSSACRGSPAPKPISRCWRAALLTDAESPRRVYALDYRGRGRSGHDPDWQNYDPRVELGRCDRGHDRARHRAGDFRRHLARRHSDDAACGGCVRPLIAGAVLNDIGPVIEMKGLLRIKGYVGKMPRPTKLCRRGGGAAAPVQCAISEAHRRAMAGLGEAELGARRENALDRALRREARQHAGSGDCGHAAAAAMGASSTRCHESR